MNAPTITIKIGEKRRTRVLLKKGHRIENEDSVTVLTEDCWVDKIETFLWDPRYVAIKVDADWRSPQYDYSSLRPVEVEPEAPRVSWWRRLFGREPKLPPARVVDRG